MVDSVTQENHWKGVRGEKKKKKKAQIKQLKSIKINLTSK